MLQFGQFHTSKTYIIVELFAEKTPTILSSHFAKFSDCLEILQSEHLFFRIYHHDASTSSSICTHFITQNAVRTIKMANFYSVRFCKVNRYASPNQ